LKSGKDLTPRTLNQIVINTKSIAGGKDNYATKAQKILAHLFAYWTLLSSKHYFQALKTTALGSDKAKACLMQAHAAQVISIFRLLGTDKNLGLLSIMADKSAEDAETILSKFLDDHLDQMISGEGKSVTLAIIAATLAHLGFKVGEVCYSRYLSDRDYKDFKDLFNAFQLNGLIQYGTFADLCERIINEKGDIRELVLAQIRGTTAASSAPAASTTPAASTPKTKEQPRVLLLDEADAFFRFYGDVYQPIANLTDSTITALIQYIWSIRSSTDGSLRFSSIAKTNQYNDCCARFNGREDLIENCVKALLSDLRTFAQHEYIVKDGKIGYKEHDAVSFNVSYGYKTLLAYFNEYTKGNVTEQTLNEKIAFYINCGTFSYAEVPKGEGCILGATGTLETMSPIQRKILEDEYGIKKSTYTPSVYGENQLEFRGDTARDVIIESQKAYHIAIADEIITRLAEGKDGKPKRAVMVFFESKGKLEEFYNSKARGSMKHNVRIMTEETSEWEKEVLISQAATTGTVILFTADFLRGTNFVCNDTELNNNGGPHVLGTFMPENVSDSIQMHYRTARQKGKGSVSYVLLDEDLKKFEIEANDIAEMKRTGKFYSTIDAKRRAYYEREYSKTIQRVAEMREAHQQSMAFREALLTGDTTKVISFITANNIPEFEEIDEPSRTLVLMDATGSMGELLKKAQEKVEEMFRRAKIVLTDNGIKRPFEVQFVGYRNYNSSRDEILVYSPWESSPENLKRFMNYVKPEGGGGWDDEAIEVALQYANREAEKTTIDQVIIIADNGPHNEWKVENGRETTYGEGYWNQAGFPKTYYKAEIQELKNKGIPVQAFYVLSNAKFSFEEMARDTGGNSAYLDISAANGADQLVDVVTKRILASVGGTKDGAKLVEAYNRKFGNGRGYVASSPASSGSSSRP
jgi:hypothetical protein